MNRLGKYVCRSSLRLPKLSSVQQSNVVRHLSSSAANTQNQQSTGEGLSLTDSCVKQIRKIADKESFLRVLVDSGGCSGFQYKFELDSHTDSNDKIFERDGARVVIDGDSLKLINGSTVDYEQELIRCAFRIVSNPLAEHGCSCGASFSVKI